MKRSLGGIVALPAGAGRGHFYSSWFCRDGKIILSIGQRVLILVEANEGLYGFGKSGRGADSCGAGDVPVGMGGVGPDAGHGSDTDREGDGEAGSGGSGL